MKYKRFFCLAILAALLLSGCGGQENPFQVIFAAPFVNEEMAAAYGDNLTLNSGAPIQYSGFSFGSESVDPMVYGAGVMMMSAMVSAGEVDVMVCDLAEAARFARGGSFYDLREVLTEEELSRYEDRLLSFDVVDEYGVPTGEKTALCGLDVSGRETLTYILASDSYGLFIAASTGDVETAREVFLAIAEP